jgi:hypothetical protein
VRPESPLPFEWSRFLAEVDKRLIDLERRANMAPDQPRVPRFLNDLDDVEVLYDSLTVDVPPVDNEVLTYDADRNLWAPAPVPGGGTGGAYSTACIQGNTSPWSELRWALASSPGLLMADNGSGDGLVVGTAGIYSVEVTADSPDVFDLRVIGPNWQWDGEDPPACRYQAVIYEQSADGASRRGGSGAIQMALHEGAGITVQIVDAVDTVYWTLSAHLICVADVVPGDCGG